MGSKITFSLPLRLGRKYNTARRLTTRPKSAACGSGLICRCTDRIHECRSNAGAYRPLRHRINKFRSNTGTYRPRLCRLIESFSGPTA